MHDHSGIGDSPNGATNSPAPEQPTTVDISPADTEGGTRSKRFANAMLIVDPGACNPSGIAYAIIEACREARAEGIGTKDDVAVRLMVTQLAWVCRADSDTEEYGELLAACRRQASAE